MDRRYAKNFLPAVLIVAVISSLLSFFIAEHIPAFKNLELRTIDLRFNFRGPIPADAAEIVIVAIDESSLDRAPDRWPWPRSYYARLLRNLKKAGAKVVAFDINFDEKDENPENDEALRRAIEEYRGVILAGRATKGAKQKGKLIQAENLLRNIFIGIPNSVPGIVEVIRDNDGISRRYVPVFEIGDSIFPSFALATLLLYQGISLDSLVDIPGNIFSRGYFQIGSIKIPKYDEISWLINYAGPSGSFRYISLIDVLDDSEFRTKDEEVYGDINTFDNPDYGLLHDEVFKDKIVLIGSAIPEFKGELGDLLPVPFVKDGSNLMYGVEIHANAIATVLERKFIKVIPTAVLFLTLFVFSILIFTASVLLRNLRVKPEFLSEVLGFFFIVLFSGGFVYLSFILFAKANYLVSTISPLMTVVFSYIGSVVFQYLTERRQKILIKTIFEHYVHPSIVDELIKSPEMIRLGGERKEMTVLFTDLYDFTKISENYPAEFIFNLLNEYFEVMTKVIFRYGGTLDKYIGDAIIAFWGAPIYYEDHALRACMCALKMQFELEKLRIKWREEGKPELYMRIGINTGEMVVGNLGGYGRFNYTVIGDSVNLGARLEKANKEFGTDIIISEYTYEKVREFVKARELGSIIVKGKTQAVRVYELVDVILPFDRKIEKAYG